MVWITSSPSLVLMRKVTCPSLTESTFFFWQDATRQIAAKIDEGFFPMTNSLAIHHPLIGQSAVHLQTEPSHAIAPFGTKYHGNIFFWDEKLIFLAMPFLIFSFDRSSTCNQVDMRVATQHAIVGMKNGMGTCLALELWIPTGKVVNRFPCCFQQQVITDSLLRTGATPSNEPARLAV